MTKPTIALPTIALPTGPFDWQPHLLPSVVSELRVGILRTAMARDGATHAIVHGNIFDYRALGWLTYFTPKLGPAFALVPTIGPIRVLFAGGPGMKPSAQRLTWVGDVIAIKSVEADIKRWIDETETGTSGSRIGLVEGRAMMRGDFLAVERAARSVPVLLDGVIDPLIEEADAAAQAGRAKATALVERAKSELGTSIFSGEDLRTAALAMERCLISAGAQDVRVRMSRVAGGLPAIMRDGPMAAEFPLTCAIAICCDGQWADARFVIGS